MIKIVWLVMAVVVAGPAAQAQVSVDMAKITCQQFVSFKIADPKLIAIWLSGYHNGKRANTLIDPQALEPSRGRPSRRSAPGDSVSNVLRAVCDAKASAPARGVSGERRRLGFGRRMRPSGRSSRS